MRRSRKHEEAQADRHRPVGRLDEAVEQDGLADEALRLQELIGNTNTTAAIARSALSRDAAGTEVEAAKGGEEAPKDGVYVMTVADVGTFDLVSWSWGDTDTGATGGGGGPGKAKFTELVATKVADKLSPRIFQYASTGQHIATVELRTVKDGRPLGIKLKDVLVSAFRAGGGDPPVDTFTLTFAELEWDLGEKDKK